MANFNNTTLGLIPSLRLFWENYLKKSYSSPYGNQNGDLEERCLEYFFLHHHELSLHLATLCRRLQHLSSISISRSSQGTQTLSNTLTYPPGHLNVAFLHVLQNLFIKLPYFPLHYYKAPKSKQTNV